MRSFLVLLLAAPCFAQPLSVGVKGGVRASDDITGFSATSESKRYVVGPMAELRLPLGFAVEVNALYRAEGYRTAFGNFAGSFTARERANSWEFPILLKYRLPVPLLRPYVTGGIAPRTLHGTEDANGFTVDIPTGQRTFYSTHITREWDSSVGAVMGGGIHLDFGRLGFSPELRYTRWTSTPINISGPQGYFFQSAQNQIDLLLGLTWKVH
jgi:hypothetical protein